MTTKILKADGVPVYCSHVKVVELSGLKPNPRNPNTHPDSQLRLLGKIIREQGWRNPIVVSLRSGMVVKGHGRIQAAIMAGLKTGPVDYQRYGSEAEETADMIADNRIAELAEMNQEELKELVKELDGLNFDIELAGFSAAEYEKITAGDQELEAPEAPVDKAKELAKKWKVKPGQLWNLGEHRLFCGDSSKAADVDTLLAKEPFACVFTDPPYGVSIGDKNQFLNTFQRAGRCLENIAGDCMGKNELFDMLVGVFSLVRSRADPCCAVYVCAPQGGELGMMMMMIASGMPTRHVLNWVKNQATFSMGRLDYEYQHEPILYTWVKTHKHVGGGAFKTSVWIVDKPRASDLHPTMKPVELYVGAYQNSCEIGATVYEPFSGSGTAILAAEATGRKCRAMEIDPKYVAVAIQRWVDATGWKPELMK